MFCTNTRLSSLEFLLVLSVPAWFVGGRIFRIYIRSYCNCLILQVSPFSTEIQPGDRMSSASADAYSGRFIVVCQCLPDKSNNSRVLK